MTQYKFVPNDFAKAAFNTAAEYTSDSMTLMLEEALGKANYDKYMIAQDPLCGGKSSGEVDICLNGEVLKSDFSNIRNLQYASIGTIYKIG